MEQAQCHLTFSFSLFLLQISLQRAFQGLVRYLLTYQNPTPYRFHGKSWVHSSADPHKGE